MWDYLTVSNVVTRDPNKKTIVKHESNERGYDFSHQLGALTTDMQRGKKVTMNGESQTIFAYDADDYSVATPTSYAPDATRGANGNGIPNGDLYAGDYVEYSLYVGAGNEKIRTDLTYDGGAGFELAALPLQHVSARFQVPRGQRIVGWEVEKAYEGGKWVERNTTLYRERFE